MDFDGVGKASLHCILRDRWKNETVSKSQKTLTLHMIAIKTVQNRSKEYDQ